MNEDVSTEKTKGTSECSWHKLVKIPEVNFGKACKTVKVTVDKGKCLSTYFDTSSCKLWKVEKGGVVLEVVCFPAAFFFIQ